VYNIPYIIAYIIAILAHIPIRGVVQKLWTNVGVSEKDNKEYRPFAWTASIIGIIERCLYIVSLQVGKPEFIAIWLGIKTAGNWKGWTEGIKQRKGHRKIVEVDGRTVFAITLIGNSLSIGYAVVAWKIAECFIQNYIYLIVIFTGTVILWIYIGYARKHWQGKPLFNKIMDCLTNILVKSRKLYQKKSRKKRRNKRM
jgi:hypothetical protein